MIQNIIGIVGLLVFVTYVFLFFSVRKEEGEENNESSMRDNIDYDGHGNYNRLGKNKSKI